jgi:mono/diheme cytochrome c family protein
MFGRSCFFFLLLTLPVVANERGKDSYHAQVLPVLEQYCYDCHSDGVKKGRFALDEHADYAALLKDQKHWDHIRQMMVTHVMPPVNNADKPSLDQRDSVVQWIDQNVFYYDPLQPDPGPTTLRRLNRTQYDNTIRDVFFIYNNYHPSASFPQDDTGYGFDNIAQVLKVSPLLMERYLREARQVSERVMMEQPPVRADVELMSSKFKDTEHLIRQSDEGLWFTQESDARAYFKVPTDGDYSLTVYAAQTVAGEEAAKVALKVDGKVVGTKSVHKEWKNDDQYQILFFNVALKEGDHQVVICFTNDYYDEKAPLENRDRNLLVQKVNVSGPSNLTQPSNQDFLEWLDPALNTALPRLDLTGEVFMEGEGICTLDAGAMVIASDGYAHHPLEIKQAGKYHFDLKLGATQAGKEATRFELRLGKQVLLASEVMAKNETPQSFELDLDLPKGKHDLRIALTNDFYDEATKQDRNLWLHEVHISGPLKHSDALGKDKLPELIHKMGERIFRRPLSSEEQTRWLQLAEKCIHAGEDVRGTVGLLIEGMLSSPAFLFHPEPRASGSRLGQTELIDEIALASRLSYFLWSAPPDDELLNLAKENKLRANLASTLKRMVEDWRSYSLHQDFAGQWLQLRDTELIAPSKRVAREWKPALAYDMRRETEKFFDHILKENRSVIDFLNADYTFLNKRLSEWYGIGKEATKQLKNNDQFVQVSLKGTPRGGVLTHGSILALTSNPTRTNLVRRGKFLLENILGTPPPPVPGDVPPLNEDKLKSSNMTLRQQFEKHRAAVNCAGCHAYLDPMGFALEQYDAVGRLREMDHGQPVDATGSLVRGQKFNNFAQLRNILVRDQAKDFVRCLTENLLTYATGRGLEYADRAAVRQIVEQAESKGYKFQELLLAICESLPFQRMRMPES